MKNRQIFYFSEKNLGAIDKTPSFLYGYNQINIQHLQDIDNLS